MASKAASKSDVDKLIEAASGKFVSSKGDWYSKLSDLGRSIADKVADRRPSGSSAIAIMQEVMESACPADVSLIPSEGTMRKWLRDRRNKKA